MRLRASWREYPILWPVIIAPSGTLKSPSMDLSLRAVRRAQHTRMKEHALAMEEYERERVQFDIDLAAAKKSKAKASS